MKIFDPGQLRIARRKAGFTLRDTAKSLFLSVSCITDKENGGVRVFADELPAFSQLYNVSIEKFFIEKVNFSSSCSNKSHIANSRKNGK